ncbi:hypothetical protein E5288_WYG011870 [Bos mutus]|uniref:Rab-GAP TBC domain-containing protein n=1 Tax=Bos mutus TaxID=72004 RepID=A0A6B0QW03_9CETA|nr:hypothetical protein [Bos mutus]
MLQEESDLSLIIAQIVQKLKGSNLYAQLERQAWRPVGEQKELLNKWNEMGTDEPDLSLFRPVYAPKDFLEVLINLRNPNYENGDSLSFRTHLGLIQVPLKVKDIPELDILYYEQLKTNVIQHDLLVDSLIYKDVKLTASNDDYYFVFEDYLYQDPDFLSLILFLGIGPLCQNSKLKSAVQILLLDIFDFDCLSCLFSPPGKLGLEEYAVFYPPNGFIPSLLILLLRISFKWMVRAFSGYLATDQLLLLWDRILGYNSLEILAVLAAAVFAFRAVNLMEVTSLAAAEPNNATSGALLKYRSLEGGNKRNFLAGREEICRQLKHSNIDSRQEAEDCFSAVNHRPQRNPTGRKKEGVKIQEIKEIKEVSQPLLQTVNVLIQSYHGERLFCEQGPEGNQRQEREESCCRSESEVVVGVTAGMRVQTVAAQTKAASFQQFQTGPGSTPLANPELTSSTGAGLSNSFLDFLKQCLNCKISNRDLASCHVAFLLYLDIESVWEGGGGRDTESWGSPVFLLGSLLFSHPLGLEKSSPSRAYFFTDFFHSTFYPSGVGYMMRLPSSTQGERCNKVTAFIELVE